MLSTATFTGKNFNEVEMWCNWHCLPIRNIERDYKGDIDNFTIQAGEKFITIYPGDTIKLLFTQNGCEIDKEFHPLNLCD